VCVSVRHTHIFECVFKAEFPNRSIEYNYMLSFILMVLWLYFLKPFCFYQIPSMFSRFM